MLILDYSVFSKILLKTDIETLFKTISPSQINNASR